MNAAKIEEILRQALRAGDAADPWDNTVLHASDLRYGLPDTVDPNERSCARQLWMRLQGGYKEKPKSDGELLMLDNAKELHKRLAALLKAAWPADRVPKRWEEEEDCSKDEGFLPQLSRGRADLVITMREWDEIGTRIVIDWKTMRGRAFAYLTGPKPAHLIQVQCYMKSKKATIGIVVYVDREGQNFVRAYPVPRDDEAVERAAERAQAISLLPDMPPVLDKIKGKVPWQCTYCSFYERSCKGAV